MAEPGALDENLELFAQLLKHRWEAGKHNGITRAAIEEWVLEAEDFVADDLPAEDQFGEDAIEEPVVSAEAAPNVVAAIEAEPIVEELIPEESIAKESIAEELLAAEPVVENPVAAESAEPIQTEPLPELAPVATQSEYIVQRKDNLWKIARTWLSTQLDHEPSNIEIWQAVFAIARENEIEDVKIIHPSTVLRIPEEFVYDSAD